MKKNTILPCCCDFWIQKKIKQIKKLSDRYLIGLTFGQTQI